METTATVEPSRSTLDAGQEGRVVLSVRNDSEVVEDYSFQVVGDAAEWSSVEPTHVSVFPGQSAAAVISFAPPRSSAVAAGQHLYAVHVRPAKRPENATVPEGSVEVLPFYDTVAELSPQSTRSKGSGQYRVTVDNRGNAPVAVALAGKSASDGMELALSESDQTMEPGTTWNCEIRTEPAKRLWRGAPVAYPFTVTVTPEVGSATALAGIQHQTPVLPAWTFKTLVGVLGLVLGAVVLYFSPAGARVCGALADPEPPRFCRGLQAAPTTQDEAEARPEAEAEPEAPSAPEEQAQSAPEAEPEAETQPAPEAQPEVEAENQPAPETQPGAGPGVAPETVSAAPVPVLPEVFLLSAAPEEFSDLSEPWPTEQATGPFTVTELTVGVSPGDVGTFNLVVFEPGGEMSLWLRRPLAEIDPGVDLVSEEAAQQQDAEGGGTDELQDGSGLQDAVDRMTDQLADASSDAGTDAGAGTGTMDGIPPVSLPVAPFTVQPEEKLLLFVQCETAGDGVTTGCYASVNLGGVHGEAETAE